MSANKYTNLKERRNEMYEKELSERKKTILKAVIEAHILGGEPVGSKYILENTALSCSSATIRNEMAELESLGYLEQPHTSSGRVPSVLGYRFYVDCLMDRYAMTSYEIAQINALLKNKLYEIDSILELASRVASSLTNYTGIAIAPSSNALYVTRYETVFIDSTSFILIMMLSNTEVKSKQFLLESPTDKETIERIAAVLNRNMTGVTSDRITMNSMMQTESEMGDYGADIINRVVRYICKSLEENGSNSLKLSGLNHLLEYPEYSDSDKLKRLLGRIETGGNELRKLIDDSNEGMNIYIGSESTIDEMNDSSLVFKPIKMNGHTIGAVGVIGPKRMDYGKVLAMIDNLSGNISMLMSDTKLIGQSGDNDNAANAPQSERSLQANNNAPKE